MRWTERVHRAIFYVANFIYLRMMLRAPSCRLISGDRVGNHNTSPRLFSSSVLAALLPVILLPFLSSFAPAQAPPAPASRFVVVLDAAHGGDDSGATLVTPDTGAEPEKTYTLELSVRLRSLLAARGISVVTTRESDVALDPGQRAQVANHANAQACLSLHAAMTGSGVHLFISSLAPVQRTAFLPWKTAQAAWVDHSIALAGMLNSALTHGGIKVTIGRTSLPAIDSMTCPAVAVEVAPPQPAQSSGHAANIGDDAYQAQVADAIAAGLLEWRAEGQNP
jgi:N-acetylmuramoyl-L-alanine amidase